MRSPKVAQCPACGEPEKEHIQFEYLCPQTSYEKDDSHPSDEGCDVATAYNKEKSLCQKCPFDVCLDLLGHKWNYYSKYKVLVLQALALLDKGMDYKNISEKLNVPVASICKFQGDRNVIWPIYVKLSKIDLTTLKGPKIL
jgi:hypothetical protein